MQVLFFKKRPAKKNKFHKFMSLKQKRLNKLYFAISLKKKDVSIPYCELNSALYYIDSFFRYIFIFIIQFNVKQHFKMHKQNELTYSNLDSWIYFKTLLYFISRSFRKPQESE